MAPSNSALWLSLGLGAFLAFHAIRNAMERHVEATAVMPREEEVEDMEAPTGSPEREKITPEISTRALGALAKHPNPQLSWSARSIIVDRILRDESIQDDIRSDAIQHENPTERKRARRAMRFLEDWAEIHHSYDDDDNNNNNDNDTFHERGASAMSELQTSIPIPIPLTERELNEMMEDLTGHRGMDRLTTLEEEVGGERFGGHAENSRQLGVENFAGLEDSRWAPEGAREEAETTRRERREAMVLGEEEEDGHGSGEGGGGWWFVRSLV